MSESWKNRLWSLLLVARSLLFSLSAIKQSITHLMDQAVHPVGLLR